MEILTDFPKIECPFIRKNFDIDEDDWRKYGKKLQLRSPLVYLAVNEIKPGYEWVFEDRDVIASEKLNGTNVKLKTDNGKLVSLMNRKNPIDPLQIIKGKIFIVEGVFRSIQKGYIKPDGIQAGEVIGPKIQGNPYKLDNHIWYPFEKAVKHLAYRSFYEHERTFDNWSSWFKDWLVSRFASKRGNKDIMAEGIVFYSLTRRAKGEIYMAKIRRDMFHWFYSDKIRIYGESKNASK
jgi:hypothetical protein